MAVLRRANRRASNRSRGLTSCKTGCSPATLTHKLFAAWMIVRCDTMAMRHGPIPDHNIMVAFDDAVPDHPRLHGSMAALRRLGSCRNGCARNHQFAKED